MKFNRDAVRDVVLLGAARGGVAALTRITSALPADFPAAVLVVMDQLPNGPRLLDELLGVHSLMPVAFARDGEPIQRSRIYLTPPDHHLTVRSDSHLGLEQSAEVRHSRLAVDLLFKSAANVLCERVIGVILTGGDHDGTDGMKAITATGGIRIVQSPADSVDPSMPANAIAGDHPQFIVMLDEIPKLLVKLVTSNR